MSLERKSNDFYDHWGIIVKQEPPGHLNSLMEKRVELCISSGVVSIDYR